MAEDINRCLNHVGYLDSLCRSVISKEASTTPIFAKQIQDLAAKVNSQTLDLGVLQSSNEKSQAQNVKLETKVGEYEAALRLLLDRMGQTSRIIAQTQHQNPQVQGRVIGLEAGLTEVLGQIGGLGRELQQRQHTVPGSPP